MTCHAMTRERRSNFLYLFLGGLAVAIVAAVLVATGTFDRRDSTAQSSLTTAPAMTTTPASTTNSAVAPNVADIYKKVSPGVVYIAVSGSQGQASGSGFVVGADGTIVTNDHVVEGADKVSVRFNENGSPIAANVLGTDPSTDLAVLKVDSSKVEGGLKPLTIADSNSVVPGQPAIAIGSPFGLQGTVTEGIISALNRDIESPNGFTISGALQTDAAINPGNSGGPLLNAAGQVIGVNSQIANNGSDSNSGVGFAISSDTVKDVVPQLKAHGKIARAWLGVSSTEQPGHDGALVGQVTGRPAQAAGLRPGDLITSFDGRKITNPSDLGQAVLTRKPGDTVKMEIQRNGHSQTVTVTLGNRPDNPTQG
jgi:S1-C subfamily serine protease